MQTSGRKGFVFQRTVRGVRAVSLVETKRQVLRTLRGALPLIITLAPEPVTLATSISAFAHRSLRHQECLVRSTDVGEIYFIIVNSIFRRSTFKKEILVSNVCDLWREETQGRSLYVGSAIAAQHRDTGRWVCTSSSDPALGDGYMAYISFGLPLDG